MAHGYLGDGYGKDGERDPNGGRDNGPNDWHREDRNRQRDDRGSDRGRFMLEGGSDRDRGENRGAGFFERAKDEARDWFRDDEHDYRQSGPDRGGRESGDNRYAQQQPRSGHSAFSSPEHAHYLNWRQQQMDALDRDYQDYCQERQQQFHSDFNSWRQNRQAGQQGSGQQRSGQQPSGAQSTELELSERDELEGTTSPRNSPQATVSPEGAATLGSNNSENTMAGRR